MLVRHGPSDFPWPGKSIAKMLKFLFDKYCSVKDQTICVNPLPCSKKIVSLFLSKSLPASEAKTCLLSTLRIK